MREKNLKQEIIIIALFLILCSNFLAPSLNVSNKLGKVEKKVEALPYIFNDRMKQEEMLKGFTDFYKTEKFEFEVADSAFHSCPPQSTPTIFHN